MFSLRGSTTVQRPSGWSAGRNCSSLVVWLALSSTMYFLIAGAADADVEALICLFVDQDILGLRPPYNVTEDLELAFGLFVFHAVEDCPVIGGPNHGANPLSLVGQQFSRPQILNVQRVLTEPGSVGGIGEQVAIVRNSKGAQGP